MPARAGRASMMVAAVTMRLSDARAVRCERLPLFWRAPILALAGRPSLLARDSAHHLVDTPVALTAARKTHRGR